MYLAIHTIALLACGYCYSETISTSSTTRDMKIRTFLITGVLLFAPAFAAAQVYTMPGTISGGSSGAVIPPGTSAIGAYMTPRFTVYAFTGLDVIAFAMVQSTCTAYTLTWGDGTNSNFTPSNPCTQAAYVSEQMKKHTYAAAGTYEVKFTADGTTDTRTVTVGGSSQFVFPTSSAPMPSFGYSGGYNPNPIPLPPGVTMPTQPTCSENSGPVCARPNGCVPPVGGSGGMAIMSCQIKAPQTYKTSCAALTDGASVIHVGACDGTESSLPGGDLTVIPMGSTAGTQAYSSAGGVAQGVYGAYSTSGSAAVSAQSSMCPVLTSALQRGSTGAEVRQLQQFLQTQYAEAQVTGYFGSLTMQLVMRFQGEHGITQTGTVGPLTRAAIAQMCN